MTKLSLNRETLKFLNNPSELTEVNGAALNIKTKFNRCLSLDGYTCGLICLSNAGTCLPPSYAC